MKRARGVLFDLDGTLVDSPSVIMAAFHDACAPYGAVPLPADARGLIGKPLDTILPLLIPRGDETVWEAAKALFRESFARRSRAAASTLVFPGVRELLTDLSEEGARIAVVTSKITRSAHELLESTGLDRHPDLVIGHDLAARGKPAPDPALLAADSLGLRPEECVVVGDSPDDVTMAVDAGMTAIGVDWGVADAEALFSAGALLVAGSVLELAGHLHDPALQTATKATR
ncbi:HAD family hydrolase [Nocardiopsis alba]|uniref:HAD family hydrolase n=2 Tax=Nocardiopsis alba TaxID=53437 RepID=A0ABV5DP47_9ACTN|nr:HAD family hydrolase [Nocardiopsis alba]AFR06996.1 HAD hydrolase, IA, variant 1 family protein [Nocardiopsis alba ATCC BAA-2165]